MAITPQAALRAVRDNQEPGSPYYATEALCWCGGPIVLDPANVPICLAVPFHSPLMKDPPCTPRSSAS